jgi:hypothetical protein
VSQGIIQSALTNKTLRLELTYTLPSMLRQEDETGMEPATHTGLAGPDSVQAISDELACLPSVI